MSRKALPVLLLFGWLLMIPPTEEFPAKSGKFRFRDDLPVSQWRQYSAHDQAQDCEAAREKEKESVDRSGVSSMINVWYESRCVPADHIYPPKTPSK